MSAREAKPSRSFSNVSRDVGALENQKLIYSDVRCSSVSDYRQWFEQCLSRRNKLEYGIGLVAIGLLILTGIGATTSADDQADMTAALGHFLIAGGLFVSLLVLRSHERRLRRPVKLSEKERLARGLRAERNFLYLAWLWYVGPLIPGLVVLWMGVFTGSASAAAVLGAAVTVVLLAWIVFANVRAARQFDHTLKDLADQPSQAVGEPRPT